MQALPSAAEPVAPRPLKDVLEAARTGEAEAQFDLSHRYDTGDGVKKSAKNAVIWLKKAAENGHLAAQLELARALEKGRKGLKADPAQSAEYFARAAEQGDIDAQYALANLYLSGTGIARDEAEAAKWLKIVAEQGDTRAQTALGSLHEQGLGVPRNPAEAARWFRIAAGAGESEAQLRLAMMLLRGGPYPRTLLDDKDTETTAAPPDGAGLDPDPVEAMRLLSLAAQQGHGGALYRLGLAHMDGLHAPLDAVLAGHYLQRAAIAGQADAMMELARRHAAGTGLPKDLSRAHMYVELAQQEAHPGAAELKARIVKQMAGKGLGEARRAVRDWRATHGS